jgi:hypothetical protein
MAEELDHRFSAKARLCIPLRLGYFVRDFYYLPFARISAIAGF